MKTIPAILASVLTSVAATAQTVVYEDFNAPPYTAAALNAQSTDSTWLSGQSWAGNGNIQGGSATNLVPATAPTGYTSTASFTNPAAIEMIAPQQATISTNFSTSSVSSGFLWVSYLANRISVNSTSDRIGVTLTSGTTNVYVGSRANDFGLGSSQGFLNLEQADNGFTGGTSHLVLAKFDLGAGSVSAWLNPTDITSEAALGTANVTTASGLTSTNGVVSIYFGEDGSNRITFDALRFSMDANSGVALSGIANPIPEPSAYALLAGIGGLCLALLRRRGRNS